MMEKAGLRKRSGLPRTVFPGDPACHPNVCPDPWSPQWSYLHLHCCQPLNMYFHCQKTDGGDVMSFCMESVLCPPGTITNFCLSDCGPARLCLSVSSSLPFRVSVSVCLSAFLSLSVCLSVCLSLSLFLIHTHVRTHARTHGHTFTYTHARTHARTNARTHARTHTHTLDRIGYTVFMNGGRTLLE